MHHPSRQPNGTNYCEKVNCSHFCLPAPQIHIESPKVTCGCPNGLSIHEDGLTCIEDDDNTSTIQMFFESFDGTHTREKALMAFVVIIILFSILCAR